MMKRIKEFMPFFIMVFVLLAGLATAIYLPGCSAEQVDGFAVDYAEPVAKLAETGAAVIDSEIGRRVIPEPGRSVAGAVITGLSILAGYLIRRRELVQARKTIETGEKVLGSVVQAVESEPGSDYIKTRVKANLQAASVLNIGKELIAKAKDAA